jgi:hypothetical protein
MRRVLDRSDTKLWHTLGVEPRELVAAPAIYPFERKRCPNAKLYARLCSLDRIKQLRAEHIAVGSFLPEGV